MKVRILESLNFLTQPQFKKPKIFGLLKKKRKAETRSILISEYFGLSVKKKKKKWKAIFCFVSVAFSCLPVREDCVVQ